MTEPRKIKVFLVEDTEEHGVLMKRALERGKLVPSLYWIKDGKAALDFLYNRGPYADTETCPRPDVILLDLKLPKVSGLEILEQIKRDEKLKNIPVVILTASDEGKDIIKSYQEGANSYFTKSVLFLNKGAGPTSILDTVMAMAGV
jgi:two-component system response regulator